MLERLAARLTLNAVIVALLVGALVIQTVRIEGFKLWPIHIHGLKAELKEAKDGRRADREAYQRAQAEAAANNLKHVREIEQRQEAISDEVTRNLSARLERLRRELRDNSAAQGSADRAGSSKGGNPAAGADGEAGVCLTPEELLRGAENEERHDQLIDWVLRQSRVNPNPPVDK